MAFTFSDQDKYSLLASDVDPFNYQEPVQEVPPNKYLEHAQRYWEVYEISDCDREAIDFLLYVSQDYRLTQEQLGSQEFKDALTETNPHLHEE